MFVDCSRTLIIFGTLAACVASAIEPPSLGERRSMLPQRSKRWRPTASRSRWLFTGDVHSRCSWRRRGNRRSLAASGDTVALMKFGHAHHLSILYVPAILLRAEACHVTRMLLCCTVPLLTPGAPWTGT